MSKYESFLDKANESLQLQNKVACEDTMKQIRMLFGPFSEEEISLYLTRLDNGEGDVMNTFQRNLVFQLFAKYFGDPYTIYSINKINYIELVIAATRYLKMRNMIILPYVISAKMDRIQNKKSINKTDRTIILSDPIYPLVKEKFQSEDIIELIFGIGATILASRFEMIDFNNPEIDKHYLDKDRHREIVYKEVLLYSLLT